MRKLVGAFLIIASVDLLGWGVDARDSLGSRMSAFFSSAPASRTIWHVLSGAACLSVGLGLLVLPRGEPRTRVSEGRNFMMAERLEFRPPPADRSPISPTDQLGKR